MDVTSLRTLLFRIVLVPLVLMACSAVQAQSDAPQSSHWVATWTASPQAARVVIPGAAPARAAPAAPAAPAAAAAPPPPLKFDNQTVRMIVRTSIGGSRLRVQLSNTFGARPLQVADVHVALSDGNAAGHCCANASIVASSDRALTFSGAHSVVIPAGATVLSDPVALRVPALAYVAVSVYVPGKVEDPSIHRLGLHTTYVSRSGDVAGATSIADAITGQSWYWLSGLDVLAPQDTGVIVAFGDSITDGNKSTPDTDRSWPSQLAKRLLAAPATRRRWAVVDEGIAGNRLLSDGAGVAALARLDRDVFSVPGVKWMIVLEGINDIRPAQHAATAQQVIDAQRQIIARAHLLGIRVLGATLTPFGGNDSFNSQNEAVREAVNHWIRTSHAYDAVADFDAAVRDPQQPTSMRPALSASDHLHPNDAGYRAMTNAIDLAIFQQPVAP